MNLRRTRAVARKEFLHILRDPRSLVMALALPFLMILLFGYALTLDVDRIPTVVYDSDQTPQSRELIARFQAKLLPHGLGNDQLSLGRHSNQDTHDLYLPERLT